MEKGQKSLKDQLIRFSVKESIKLPDTDVGWRNDILAVCFEIQGEIKGEIIRRGERSSLGNNC